MILITIIGTVVGTIKVLWKRIEENLDNNFKSMQMKLEDVSAKAEKNQSDIRDIERRLYQFQIDLPHAYVARDDYIRGQTVIESKLDALANKLENVQIKQGITKND